MPERALAPHHGADEIAARAEPPVARSRCSTISPSGEHELERQHVVRRRAVLERVRPARVLRDVPADRAGQLTRWIRARRTTRAPPPRLGQIRVDHPRLHDRVCDRSAFDTPGSRFMPRAARSPRHRRSRVAPPESPVPGPARHERHPVLAAHARTTRRHLLGLTRGNTTARRGFPRCSVSPSALVDERARLVFARDTPSAPTMSTQGSPSAKLIARSRRRLPRGGFGWVEVEGGCRRNHPRREAGARPRRVAFPQA